jgi:hypothetical protein
VVTPPVRSGVGNRHPWSIAHIHCPSGACNPTSALRYGRFTEVVPDEISLGSLLTLVTHQGFSFVFTRSCIFDTWTGCCDLSGLFRSISLNPDWKYLPKTPPFHQGCAPSFVIAWTGTGVDRSQGGVPLTGGSCSLRREDPWRAHPSQVIEGCTVAAGRVKRNGRIRYWAAFRAAGSHRARGNVGRRRDHLPCLSRPEFGATGNKRGVNLKLHYYPETDSLYIALNATPSTDSREISEGLVADFDAGGSGSDSTFNTLPRGWTSSRSKPNRSQRSK